MKKIIMLLTNEFLPDVRVYKEAVYLISKGFSVEILCWQRDAQFKLPEEEIIDGIHIKRFLIPAVAGTGKKQLKAFAKYIKCCKIYLNNNSCDYLHCNDIDGAITGYLARKHKTPMVFDMHEFYEKGNQLKKIAWRKLTIFLIKKSIAAIRVNDAYLSANYSSIKEKLYLLKNYPDSSLIQCVPKTKSDCFRVGFHGDLRGMIQNFTALFEAVKNFSDVRVDVNGGGPIYSELKSLESNYKNVFINGVFNGTKDLSKLYSNTDVLFCGYNSNSENWNTFLEPVKYFEAIITGTPIIATKNLYFSNSVEKNVFGICCDTKNIDELKSTILKLKTDSAFWKQCSENELRNADNYDWRKAVTVLDDIYFN